MGVVHNLPWWAKLSAKLMLSRLPVPYGFWRRLGLFRHGDMDDPARALAAFRANFEKANAVRGLPAAFNSLELGPGDSILSGIVAKAYGGARVYLVDTGAYAQTDMRACVSLAGSLRADGRPLPDISDCRSIAEVLRRCGISYLTRGTASFADIPDASIDFFWSQAVLEHVVLEELPTLLKELRRVVRRDAIGIHGVDFKDHLGGSLNNLRFSQRVWESAVFRNSGFYTNRIRFSGMIKLFEHSGFKVTVAHKHTWSQLPLIPRRMAPPFGGMAEEELRVAEAEFVIRPA